MHISDLCTVDVQKQTPNNLHILKTVKRSYPCKRGIFLADARVPARTAAIFTISMAGFFLRKTRLKNKEEKSNNFFLNLLQTVKNFDMIFGLVIKTW